MIELPIIENINISPHIAHPNPASSSNLFASSSVIFFKFMPEDVKQSFNHFSTNNSSAFS